MRKIFFKRCLLVGSLMGSSIFTGGCSMMRYVGDNIEEKIQYKDVKVHTEEEMKVFALERLKDKYDQEFTITDDLIYKHQDGQEDRPMYLNGYAYVTGNQELDCYFEVREPNIFVDDYATNYYEEDIKEYLKESLKEITSDYEIFVSYTLSSASFDPKMDFKEYLYNDNCCIDYTAYVKSSEDAHQYISVIREWMEKLYGAKYRWYFELHDIEDTDKCYFSLYPGDNGFDSADDWDDELIYKYIDCFN